MSQFALDVLRQRYVVEKRQLEASVEKILRSDRRAGARAILAAIDKRRFENRSERQRLRKMLRFETSLWESGHFAVAGVDEAGMSPLAGPAWVHDASATPAKVLLRWDDVMASSALRSALRYTACMQAVYLKPNCGRPGQGAFYDQSGTGAQFQADEGLGRRLRAGPGPAIGRVTEAMGLSLQTGAPAKPAKSRPQKPCDGTFAGADRWPAGAKAWSRHHQP